MKLKVEVVGCTCSTLSKRKVVVLKDHGKDLDRDNRRLSGLFPVREGFTAPHHGQLNFGSSSGGSSSTSKHSLVKDNLRHAIHSRRALSHNPIIRPEDLVPKDVKFKLTPEEEEKRKLRREKNKVAASKCRNKKREMVNTTKIDYEKVTTSNSHMEREIERLKKERQRLQETLNSHECAMLKGRQPHSSRDHRSDVRRFF